MASKRPSPITLVVRRGAVRRFNKLQKDTRNLPVVVTWDRRSAEATDRAGTPADRRAQPSFTWELADFLVVPGEAAGDAEPGPAPAAQGEAAGPAEDE